MTAVDVRRVILVICVSPPSAPGVLATIPRGDQFNSATGTVATPDKQASNLTEALMRSFRPAGGLEIREPWLA